MSDINDWNHGDPFAPEVVEDSIARSLQTDAPATPTSVLARTLANAYELPPATDAVLARSRAILARRAAALNSRGLQMMSSGSSGSWTALDRSTTHQSQTPRRRDSQFATVWRTVAAVLVVAVLSAGFFALLQGVQRHGSHTTPTATPVSSTTTPGAPTPTTISPQPPAPAGVYVTAPGTVFQLNTLTGAIQQRYPLNSLGQGIPGMPVVGNGMVYFPYQSNVTTAGASYVAALSATSGAVLWRTQTAAELGQLVLADGTLYGGTLYPDAGTDSNGTGIETFYALRASDGSVSWTFNTSTLRSPAVVAGGVVYLTDQPADPTRQHVRAFRASDGSQLWDSPLPQACASADNVAVDAGMVFVACHAQFDMGQGGNGSVYGLRTSDGSVLWHYTVNGEPNSGLAAGAGLAYFSPGGKNAAGVSATGLYALDETSGVVRWQVANANGWPVFDGTTVYAGVGTASLGWNLAAFSASHGTQLWTYQQVNQRIETPEPVIAGGVVYEIVNEQVLAISAANGTMLWRSPTFVSQQQGVGGLTVVIGG
jgi:outer membrane protein assembly factor BamB